MSAATFRTEFPAFANTTVYTDGQIAFWFGLAALLILDPPWGELQDAGQSLYVAHNLSLEAQSAKAAAGGGAAGVNSGVVTSKQIDKLSVGYDASVGLYKDAGQWNLTTYGARFYQLMRLVGAGGYQAGAGPAYNAPGTILAPYGI